MVGKLNRLPLDTQMALQQLACLGNIAPVRTLSLILEKSSEERRCGSLGGRSSGAGRAPGGSYQFVHDRVQEAAYSLIPEAQRDEAHLRIGRRLAAHIPPEQREEAIFDIVNQFNRGAALITSRDEREQVAELNLLAGKRAKASAAYASALKYLVAGAALLPADSWERQHAVSFELELHRAECEFLTGALAVSEERLKLLSARAANTVERAAVACLRAECLHDARSERARRRGRVSTISRTWESNGRRIRHESKRWANTGGSGPCSAGAISRILIELPLMSDPAMLGLWMF